MYTSKLAIPFKECGLNLFEGKLLVAIDKLDVNLLVLGEKLKQARPYWLIDFDWIINEEG
ncbi:MAG: hypothetical protein F6K11_20105 [Leptolyngbya sp. SIO3F4]|nr:hypothetical protein [Leptolyngbya sp. SIO3F4]